MKECVNASMRIVDRKRNKKERKKTIFLFFLDLMSVLVKGPKPFTFLIFNLF